MSLDNLAGLAGRLIAAPGGNALDVVAVLRGSGPAFSGSVRPLTVYVTREARLMEHPLEDGSVVTDHIVHQPTTLDLSCMLVGDYRSAYSEIAQLFQEGAVLTVATKADVFPSMVISDMPHEEDPIRFDAIPLIISLKEAKFVTPETGDSSSSGEDGDKLAGAEDKASKPTTNRGQQSGSTPSKSAASTASSNAGKAQTGSKLYQWTYGQ